MDGRNPMKDARREIAQLLDHIDDETDWNVIDYNPNIGPYELTSVRLTVEKQPDSGVQYTQETNTVDESRLTMKIRTIIHGLTEDNPDGAPEDKVIERMTEEFPMDKSEAEHELEKCQARGMVYELSNDRWKVA